MQTEPICSIPECDTPARIRGYCMRCYCRLRYRGELPLLPRREPSNLAKTNGEEKLRKVWRAMHARCTNPADDHYHVYGGRGIRVCDEWAGYEPFRAWALGSGYRDGLTIDRINNDRGYEPGNCRWTTRAVQNRNKGNNHLLTAFGETKTMKDWSEDPRCVVTYAALNQRIVRRKWDTERALTTPTILNNDKATHCPSGHPYDEENTGRTPEGHRYCKPCKREYQRSLRARRTARR